jgi:aminoglycoside phosphotransferase (APT) family kinase protein
MGPIGAGGKSDWPRQRPRGAIAWVEWWRRARAEGIKETPFQQLTAHFLRLIGQPTNIGPPCVTLG